MTDWELKRYFEIVWEARRRQRARAGHASKRASIEAGLDAIAEAPRVRMAINIDDELLAKATGFTGTLDRSAVVREGLKALIERESARRLARLAVSQPGLGPPRRRW